YERVAGGTSWSGGAYGRPSFERFRRAPHTVHDDRSHADYSRTDRTHADRARSAPESAIHGGSVGCRSDSSAVDLPRTLDDAYAALHLQSGAPQSVVKAAY